MSDVKFDKRYTELDKELSMLESQLAELEQREKAGTLSPVALRQHTVALRKWYLQFQHAAKLKAPDTGENTL